MKTDQEIKQGVEAELHWDPRLDESDIAVAVRTGAVTLTGFAHSYRERHDAEAAAKRVAGVQAVANDVEVRCPGKDERPDPEIARDIAAGIKSQLPNVFESIKSVVSDGRIVLEGEVDWHFQREKAEEVARGVAGVKGVLNSIRLKQRATPAQIRSKISEAIRRSAAVDAASITVDTQDSEVTLRGQVRSWAEWQEADRTAWAAPGVRRVDNRITVTG